MNSIRNPLATLVVGILALWLAPVRGAELTASYSGPITVPVTEAGYTATGNTVDFTLNFAPTPGTILKVIDNTGTDPIEGTFSDLVQGQKVQLTYDGVSYRFVADYFGGTGNDLVLRWGNTRVMGWGGNLYGQLGDGTARAGATPVPLPADMTGVLAGKTVIAISGGDTHTLALCADGTVAAWGDNRYGRLGNGTTIDSSIPVLVEMSGVLSGKTIIAISAGLEHSLALCSDGTMVAWGDNANGRLGNGSTVDSSVPVLVAMAGVLAGKTVTAISAGYNHNLALCSDGTVVAWGKNSLGLLGDGSTTQRRVPVLVDQTGVLFGKTVIAISAGGYHSLALCSDGAVAAWGGNSSGQLGNNDTAHSSVPVLVDQTGALSDKAVTAVFAGGSHSLALCSDGSTAAWGENGNGQLGIGGTTDSSVPVLTDPTGVFSGKTVVAVSPGHSHNLALGWDGTAAAWGNNSSGSLGNNSTTQSSVPVAVHSGGLGPEERFVGLGTGVGHSLALVASPPPPVATTLSATGVADMEVTLNGTVNAQGSATAVSFEYGLTSSYGSTNVATPALVTGTTTTVASAALSGLRVGSTYHYRVVVTNSGGTVRGEDRTFTTTTSATLSSLVVSDVAFAPVFSSDVRNYAATVAFAMATTTVEAVATTPGATVSINGSPVETGTATAPLVLAEGSNRIEVVVASADGSITNLYTVMVTRLLETYTFNSAQDVPLAGGDLDLTGNAVAIELNYAPTPGTTLTVVEHSGIVPFQGEFSDLAQGQMVSLTYEGISYPFIADYFGGTGNDLVLRWGNTRMLSWGANEYGQLGNNSTITTVSSTPVPVYASGVLSGRQVIAVSTGNRHNIVLCSDGTVAAWGANSFGELGDNSRTGSNVPLLVDRSGVLSDKTVIAVSAGASHNLALCSDGTVAAWGQNYNGELGNNSRSDSSVPVLVDRTGVLSGKTVIAISAGGSHSLVLCSDGTLAAWGANSDGSLGNGSTAYSIVPVLVDQSGVLSGKSVAAVSAGDGHSIALCSDGTVAAWGNNSRGQLGNNSRIDGLVPVLLEQTGALAAKTVVAVSAGGEYSLALCSDGSLAAWGINRELALGNGSAVDSDVPVLVDQSGVLADRTVTAISAGRYHGAALCSDGNIATWGAGARLGNGTGFNSAVPVMVDTTPLVAQERFAAVSAGGTQSLTLVASPPWPLVTTLAATGIADRQATLNSTISAQGSDTAVSFEYGLTSSYGSTVDADPATVIGTSTAPSANLGNLLSGTTYHYRVVATNLGGTVRGEDRTFTTSALTALSSLTLNTGTLAPVFFRTILGYSALVPFGVEAITLAAIPETPGAVVTIGGIAVESGEASGPLDLVEGSNRIEIVVTPADGGGATTYSVTVYRLLPTYRFSSAAEVPLTVADLDATGSSIGFTLEFAPTPGTNLTLVDNTGTNPIQGTFVGLAQGQKVQLDHGGVSYAFVADYFGGTGNDLVLRWAHTRITGWGRNGAGQLGNSSVFDNPVPTSALTTGVLADKTIVASSAGGLHSLVLCADGTMAAWGSNVSGRLGINSTITYSPVPVLVDQTGVLAGRTVVAMSAGVDHTLVLCSDGVVAAWGSNDRGKLGNNSSVDSKVPVLVDQTGVLSGKKVIAISTGGGHSLALCLDGTVVSWGSNGSGVLGNNRININSPVPVMVDQTGVLLGKTVVEVAAGLEHSLVLCSDGTVAAWGYNVDGRLGDDSGINSSVPVLVKGLEGLSSDPPIGISAGFAHSLALFPDGTVAGWGSNASGQVGNGSLSSRIPVPVPVDTTGALSGKTVIAISASNHSLALCSDGTMVVWGNNDHGQFGNNVEGGGSHVPVAAGTSGLGGEERFATASAGISHSLALVVSPPPPVAETLEATVITDRVVKVTGSVNAQGSSTVVSFEYGLTTDYGTTRPATPTPVNGAETVVAEATIEGLLPATIYHYRVIATGSGGTVMGDDRTFTTSALTALSSLSLSGVTLDPSFAATTTSYLVAVPNSASSTEVTPAWAHPQSSVKINGAPVASGVPGDPINLAVGDNIISIVVLAEDGITTNAYTVHVFRQPRVFTLNSASEAPLTVGNLGATGSVVGFVLNHKPAPGATLMVIDNTGNNLIRGTFDNLAQGQIVELAYGGETYPFAANYNGGTGNDLVLHWAHTRLVAWGGGGFGLLGNPNVSGSPVPVPVEMTGVLSGRTVLAVSAGSYHSLAVCADGFVAAWGLNSHGQLGDNTTTDSMVPVAVDQSGVLAGKTVVEITAGLHYSIARCSDGTLAAWGYNYYGQLGNGDTADSPVPVLVDQTGVLSGKTVTAIAAGSNHTLALCSDGRVAAWGIGSNGQLGNNSRYGSHVPVYVDRGGALSRKRVTAISAGKDHSLVLTSDGTVAAWGYNSFGQLGNNGGSPNPGTSDALAPVLVNQSSVLSGKTIIGIAAGGAHSVALCADGTLASWGYGGYGQLGNLSTGTYSLVPVLVDQTGVLARKQVTDISAGENCSFALSSDGVVTAWGHGGYGQLGNNSTADSRVPVLVNTDTLGGEERFLAFEAGSTHALALLGSPTPTVGTLPVSAVSGTGATVSGVVNAHGNATKVFFEYGSDDAYGNVIDASPAAASGSGDTPVSAEVRGLMPGTTYHYRVLVKSNGLFFKGADMAFTTLSDNALLAGLSHDGGGMVPAFEQQRFRYLSSVAFATTMITVGAVTDHPGATVTVNGADAHVPVALAVGNNPLTVLVTAEDGVATKAYVLTVTRLPRELVFNSGSEIPVTADGFAAPGVPAILVLNYAPVPGTILRVIDNTGLGFIHGAFSNLQQGQRIALEFDGRSYDFVADYFGGTGNDLVLQWAATRTLAWGSNSYGQLGDDSTTRRLEPVAVSDAGVLSGKAVTAVSAGYLHSLALCSDGRLAAWGYNVFGQLGNGGSGASDVPVEVDQTGALAGRTVVAIAAGPFHNLALCTDGTVVAWGYNNHGQLGTGDLITRRVPVAVEPVGALSGKQVVGVAAGAYQSFARCADGTVAGWGYNDEGELGDGTVSSSMLPVPVDASGVLAGRQVASLSAGQYHMLALCTDGTLVSWGYNDRGQLGDNSMVSSNVPVVVDVGGVLAGRTVVAARAGDAHGLALCADGTLAAWGSNARSQLGVAGISQSTIPVAVDLSGLSPDQAITAIAVGRDHNMMRFADGGLSSWGNNADGQLGNKGTTTSGVPGMVDTSAFDPGTRFMFAVSGSSSGHSVAVAGVPQFAVAEMALWLRGFGAQDMGGALDDPDHDGIANIVEYAFGLDPMKNSTGCLPGGRIVGGNFVLSFTQPAGISDIIYGAEWSTTLEPGSWADIPDTGSGDTHSFSMPMTSLPNLFIRLKVLGQVP